MFGFLNKPRKVFCVGRNKTGTTSLKYVLLDFGYKLGDQRKGEQLLRYYKVGDWRPIRKYCKSAEAFQDAPFSWPNTWLILHHYFPEGKFILTVRGEDEWYRSITRYHSARFSEDRKRPPIKEELKEARYVYKGFMWDSNRAVWKTPENDPYNKDILIRNYRNHNESVRHFFQDKPNFLEIDVAKKDSYARLCEFLGREPKHDSFPHVNATVEFESPQND